MKGCSYCGDHLTHDHQPEGDEKELAAYLKTTRQRAGLSIEEVAARSGYPEQTITNLEAGTGEPPTPRCLYCIAEVLDVKYLTLLTKVGYVAKRRKA